MRKMLLATRIEKGQPKLDSCKEMRASSLHELARVKDQNKTDKREGGK